MGYFFVCLSKSKNKDHNIIYDTSFYFYFTLLACHDFFVSAMEHESISLGVISKNLDFNFRHLFRNHSSVFLSLPWDLMEFFFSFKCWQKNTPKKNPVHINYSSMY